LTLTILGRRAEFERESIRSLTGEGRDHANMTSSFLYMLL
jgi:hypothetical protein